MKVTSVETANAELIKITANQQRRHNANQPFQEVDLESGRTPDNVFGPTSQKAEQLLKVARRIHSSIKVAPATWIEFSLQSRVHGSDTSFAVVERALCMDPWTEGSHDDERFP